MFAKQVLKGQVKFATLKYDHAQNLGDEIQSLAVEQYLPAIDASFDRDSLGLARGAGEYKLVMNGWFSYRGSAFFPPSDCIQPVFFGFHITEHNRGLERFLTKENIEYFRSKEPIGCRDKRTMEVLQAAGIRAFYSKCLTLTFPKREAMPAEGKVFVVDADHIPIPPELHRQHVIVSQDTYPFFDNETKRRMATQLLETYKREARLVITTRLHCALPCIAMGIPVVFFGSQTDTRVALVQDIGLRINPIPLRAVGRAYRVLKFTFLGSIIRALFMRLWYRRIDWNPESIDIEEEKQAIRTSLLQRLFGKSSDVETSDKPSITIAPPSM